MSNKVFDISEFMKDPSPAPENTSANETEEEQVQVEELDVQKAVVEQLASENAELKEALDKLKVFCKEQLSQVAAMIRIASEVAGICEKSALKESEITTNAENRIKELTLQTEQAKKHVKELEEELAKHLEKEFEEEGKRNPNSIALLDRDVDIPDRFPGETRDHVIEILKDALKVAQESGRYRRAKLLEGVLLANESGGGLEKRRENMRRLFEENGNLVNGTVINVLNKYGIAYRDGENYLMPSEIMSRTY